MNIISHILQKFIPYRFTVNYNLCTRSHNKHLCPKTIDLTEQNFLIRNLYKDRGLHPRRQMLVILYFMFVFCHVHQDSIMYHIM